MDIERLKELKAEFEQVRKYNDRHYMSTVIEDDVIALIDDAIARQSVKSEEVAEAIKRFEKRNHKLKEVQDNGDAGCVDIETWEKYQGFIKDNDIAITVLKDYQSTVSKTETTSCEWCKSFDRFEFNPIDHDGNCIPDEYCMVQSGLAAYCPNCGRKLQEEQP